MASTPASTPAATSRRHCLSLALASLILADVSGQIIFIPTSMMSSSSSSSSLFSDPSSPSSSSSRGLLLGGGGVGIASSSTYDESPCRQRRLEPFRQLVREECRADAEAHCRRGGDDAHAAARDLSSLFLPPTSPGGRDEEWKRMGSLLDAIFAPPPSSYHHAGDSGDADSFERMFEEMMNWSLSAFDRASSSSSAATATAAVEPPSAEEGRAAPKDTGEEEDVRKMEGDGTDDFAIPIAPEVAAENALDVAVAELARRSIHRAGSEDGAAVPAVAAPRALPDVGELHDRLFRLGSGLLSEAHGRRRLLEAAGGEADAAVDPRARTKERLARRLTEYRTDLFYHPDGTVTVYTRSHDPRPAADARPPLGFGDDRVDECMASLHANGDLSSGCRYAVDAFLRATTDRTLVAGGVVARSRSIAFAPPPADADADNSFLLEVVFYNLVSFSAAFLVIALIIDWVRNSYDEDEDEEEEGGDADEDEGGFDYEMLQEGDRDLVDRDGREGGEEALTPRVYVGVPVQVV